MPRPPSTNVTTLIRAPIKLQPELYKRYSVNSITPQALQHQTLFQPRLNTFHSFLFIFGNVILCNDHLSQELQRS
jgi:hypothetical protein